MDEPECPAFEGLPSLLPGLGEACSLVGPPKQVVPEWTHHAHWQLRDGVCVWRNWIFINQKHSILCLDPHSAQRGLYLSTTFPPPRVASLPFLPDDIAQGRMFRWDGWEIVSLKVLLDKYLLIGGDQSQLVVMDLESSEALLFMLLYSVMWTCKLPGSMINSTALQRWQGETRLLVCNNSSQQTVQVPLPQLPTLINGVAASPNNKWLVMAGDSPTVFVYDIREGNYNLVRAIPCLAGNNNVSWNLHSTRFALSSEAGCCQIYCLSHPDEPESISLEHTIWNLGEPNKSDNLRGTGVTLPNWKQAGTVPLVRFSGRTSMSEKVLIVQSSDYVQVVDLRLNVRQAIHLADHLPSTDDGACFQEISTSGGDFSPDGRSFFVGSNTTDHGGFLWEFPLQEVPTLLDLALAFVQVNFADHWTEKECAQRLPPDLMQMILPSFVVPLPCYLPGNDEEQIEQGRHENGFRDEEDNEEGERVWLSRLLMQAFGWAAIPCLDSSPDTTSDPEKPTPLS